MYTVEYPAAALEARIRDLVRRLYCVSTRQKVSRPKKRLCGFARVHLRRSEERRLTVRVAEKDGAFYDEREGALVSDNGYHFMTGGGSEDIRAKAAL